MDGYSDEEWEDAGVVWESDFDSLEDLPPAEAAALLDALTNDLDFVSREWLDPDEQVARVTYGSDQD